MYSCTKPTSENSYLLLQAKSQLTPCWNNKQQHNIIVLLQIRQNLWWISPSSILPLAPAFATVHPSYEWRQRKLRCYIGGVNLQHNSNKCPCRTKHNGHINMLTTPYTYPQGGNMITHNHFWMKWCHPIPYESHNPFWGVPK